MHIHYLQHLPVEGMGRITACRARAGRGVAAIGLFAKRVPWLVEEQASIRRMAAAGPVSGVRLGVRFIAEGSGELFNNLSRSR